MPHRRCFRGSRRRRRRPGQRSQEAARLFGAADPIRDDTGYHRCVSERDADLDALRATLGEDGFEAAFEEGAALSLDEAVAYARRGRGERKRPETGWASLTPAEIRVAELVKDGLSNADIGRRLLCSARTVQAHLTHIYAKLGITSRAELAAKHTAILRGRYTISATTVDRRRPAISGQVTA